MKAAQGNPCTPYPELPLVLSRFAAGLRDNLAGELVGAYLVGSLALGGFDLDSDVDFLVVTRSELTRQTILALEALHREVHAMGCYPAQHLEGSYMPLHLLNQPEAVGAQPLWFLDNGSQVLERSVHCNRWHVRWVLRHRAVVLLGPEASELVGPIPPDAIAAEARDTLRRVAKEFAAEMDGPLAYYNTRFGQSFAVVNSCRVLLALRTAAMQPKLAGVNWARQHLAPGWAGLIEQAWQERVGVRHCVKIRQAADTEVLKETLRFLQYVLQESEQRNEPRPPGS